VLPFPPMAKITADPTFVRTDEQKRRLDDAVQALPAHWEVVVRRPGLHPEGVPAGWEVNVPESGRGRQIFDAGEDVVDAVIRYLRDLQPKKLTRPSGT
jgi:hypothetical protein